MNLHLWMPIPLTDHWVVGRIGGWLRRYLPAEIAGTTAALLGLTMALQAEQSMATTAVVGVWSEVIGFYSVIVVQEWLAEQRRCRQSPGNSMPLHTWCKQRSPVFRTFCTSVRQTIGFLSRLLRNLVLEFGAAELLDPLILRPALLMLAMQLLSDLPVALLAGKVTADLVFYTVTICSLEARKKLLTT